MEGDGSDLMPAPSLSLNCPPYLVFSLPISLCLKSLLPPCEKA